MKGQRLSYEILGVQAPKRQTLPNLDYSALINQQEKAILQLQREIKYLRQYIKYFVGEKHNQNQVQTDSSLKNEQASCEKEQLQKKKYENKRTNGLRNLVKEVMNMIGAENIDQILQKLKVVIEKANRKMEPIFVQKIKYKEVAVPVQVIKQVEKYVQVIKQKIVEVPIFRQKIVERFVDRPPEVSGVISPRSLKIIQEEYRQKEKGKEIQKERERQKQVQKQRDQERYRQRQRQRQRQGQRDRDRDNRQQDFTKKKLNFVESPRHNQTYNMKSPKFKEKEREKVEYKEKFFPADRSNFPKSPKYKQRDY